MTSKPEGPGKDASRPADTQHKRPHATLDLRATEVKGAEPPKPEAKPEAGAAKSAESKPADPKAPAAATGAGGKPGDTSSKANDAQRATAPGSAAAIPPPPRASGGGLSHVFASLAGGVIALAGAYGLDQGGALSTSGASSERTEALESRLAAMEKAAGAPASDPVLASRLEEATSRVARLEALSAQVEQLTSEQSRLAAEAKGLGEKLGAAQPDQAAVERLAKLEDRLATLSAAAGSDGDKGGRVANLAAITGKIADLESRIDNQIAALRKSIPEEVAGRLGTVAEASEAARVTSQRVDREVQTLRTDVVRLGQRAEELKAGDDRLTQTLDVLKEEQGRTASTLDGFKNSVETQLKSVARPADVTSAVAPVADRLARLEGNIEGVVRNEADRKVDAERIVVSLELANLKRAVDSGKGYAAELAAVQKAAGGRVDLSALEKHQSGLPPLADLEAEFRRIANSIIDAEAVPTGGGVVDNIVAGALSVVRVRKIDPDPSDKSAEAVVARIEKALAQGQLGDALEHAKGISDKAAGRASDWRVKAEARHAVDRAIAGIEAELKASLAGAVAAPAAPASPSVGPN